MARWNAISSKNGLGSDSQLLKWINAYNALGDGINAFCKLKQNTLSKIFCL